MGETPANEQTPWRVRSNPGGDTNERMGWRRLPTRTGATQVPYRQAVWSYALHREAVSFNGLYVTCDPQELFLIELLFYHSAILYERRGCGYLLGREVMEEIHAAFGEDGAYRARAIAPRLTARRRSGQPGAEFTVRGRSWALHDGVAGTAWDGVKMYKAAGRHAGIDTFPGGTY
jgi:hypothetical protein